MSSQEFTELIPSARSSSSTSALVIDEAFSKQSPQDFFLVSKRNFGFYFPRSILINQSTFFTDLETIGSAGGSSTPYQSVELSNISPGGLRWGLHVLNYILTGGHLPRFDGDELEDTLRFADMYDLPIISRMLYHLYMPEVEDPFWLLVLAHFADRKDDLIRLRIRTLTKNILHMPLKAKMVLKEFAPQELLLLYELHQERTADYITLNVWLTDFTDRGAYFADGCAAARCPTYMKYGGDWWAARVHVGSLVWQNSQHKSEDAVRATATEVLYTHFACASCRTRILEAWEPALVSYTQHTDAE